MDPGAGTDLPTTTAELIAMREADPRVNTEEVLRQAAHLARVENDGNGDGGKVVIEGGLRGGGTVYVAGLAPIEVDGETLGLKLRPPLSDFLCSHERIDSGGEKTLARRLLRLHRHRRALTSWFVGLPVGEYYDALAPRTAQALRARRGLQRAW